MTCPRPFCPPADPIVCPPRPVIRDFFHPQVLPIIHPIEVINRHHCCAIPRHVFTVVEREEVVGPVEIRSVKNGKRTVGTRGVRPKTKRK